MPITGGCLCGAVRYVISEAPLAARTCWCRLCQYLGAGSGTVNAVFRRGSVAIAGILQHYDSLAESGNHMCRQFCGQCGTQVCGYAEERPEVIVIRVGTLDDQEAIRPTSTIWVSAAPTWACIDTTLPQILAQPPPVG